MSTLFAPRAIKKEFLPQEFRITVWSRLKPYYGELLRRHLTEAAAFDRWWADFKELSATVDEEYHLHLLRLQQQPNDKKVFEAFSYFILEVYTRARQFEQSILQRLLKLSERFRPHLFNSSTIKAQLNRHKEQNIQLQQEIIVKVRHWLRPGNKAAKKGGNLSFLEELSSLRQQLASNIGYSDYSVYHFAASHQQVELQRAKLYDSAQQLLKIGEQLLSQPTPALPLFAFLKTRGFSEIFTKGGRCLAAIDPSLEQYLQLLRQARHYDFKQRSGRTTIAVIPMPLSGTPYLQVHTSSDSEFLRKLSYSIALAAYYYIHPGSPIAEGPSADAIFAAQGILWMSSEHWQLFFDDAQQLHNAQVRQLQHLLREIRIAMATDRFEQALYTEAAMTGTALQARWQQLLTEAKQDAGNTHQLFTQICERPFEGIRRLQATMAALHLWQQYHEQPEATVAQFLTDLQSPQHPPFPEKEETICSKWSPTADTFKKVATFVANKISPLLAD